MNLPKQNRTLVSLVAALALGFSAVYMLPYLVPVHDGISYSYMFGFNNRAAVVLLVVFIALFAVWTKGLGLTLPDPSAGPTRDFRRTGYVAIGCAVVGAGLVWLYSATIFPVAEAQYFLDRHELFRMGLRPFRDFEFYYGPIMFYLPVWVGRLTHLSLGNSQFLAWVLEWGVGTWMLWKTVEMASGGTERGRTIFLLWWGFFMLSALVGSGSNYTPLRFCPTLLIALVTHRLYTRGTSMLATFGLAAAGASTMLFYSPEQGISLTIATLLFFLLCVRNRRRGTFAGLALYAGLMGSALAIAYWMGALDSILIVGGGTLNFPLVGSFQSIFLILLLVVAGCAVAAGFRDRMSNHPLCYLICVSLVNLPAAFSRADSGHIMINALGALLVAFIVLSQYPAAWRWVRVAFVMLICTMVYLVPVSGQVLTAAFSRQYHSRVAEIVVVSIVKLVKGKQAGAYLEFLRSRHTVDPKPDAPNLPVGQVLYAPLGVQRRISSYDLDPQIITGRSVLPMANPLLVQETIGDMEAHPDWPILVPAENIVICEESPEGIRGSLRQMLAVPYTPKLKRTRVGLTPLCDYINTHYKPSEYNSPVAYFYVWSRNGR